MNYETVGEYLIWTQEGYGNSIAMDLGERIYVIDSMFNWELAEEWKKVIEQYFNEKVSGLILSHHHADHTFGNQVFSGLPIISSIRIRKILMDFEKKVWPTQTKEDLEEWEAGGYGVRNLHITHPNICFENKLQLFGKRSSIEVIQADGHTDGSTYLWEPESKTVIAGDLVFNKQFPYGGDETCNPIKWHEAIKKIIRLKPKTVISGHGPPASKEDLEEIHNFFNKSFDFIRQKLNEGLKFQEIAGDPNFPEYYSHDRVERKRVTIERWVKFFKEHKE